MWCFSKSSIVSLLCLIVTVINISDEIGAKQEDRRLGLTVFFILVTMYVLIDYIFNKTIVIDKDGVKFNPSRKIIFWHEIKDIKFYTPYDNLEHSKLIIDKIHRSTVRKRVGFFWYYSLYLTHFSSWTISDYCTFSIKLNSQWGAHKLYKGL